MSYIADNHIIIDTEMLSTHQMAEIYNHFTWLLDTEEDVEKHMKEFKNPHLLEARRKIAEQYYSKTGHNIKDYVNLVINCPDLRDSGNSN